MWSECKKCLISFHRTRCRGLDNRKKKQNTQVNKALMEVCDDALYSIFEFCDVDSLSACSRVCTDFRRLIDDRRFWLRWFKHDRQRYDLLSLRDTYASRFFVVNLIDALHHDHSSPLLDYFDVLWALCMEHRDFALLERLECLASNDQLYTLFVTSLRAKNNDEDVNRLHEKYKSSVFSAFSYNKLLLTHLITARRFDLIPEYYCTRNPILDACTLTISIVVHGEFLDVRGNALNKINLSFFTTLSQALLTNDASVVERVMQMYDTRTSRKRKRDDDDDDDVSEGVDQSIDRSVDEAMDISTFFTCLENSILTQSVRFFRLFLDIDKRRDDDAACPCSRKVCYCNVDLAPRHRQAIKDFHAAHHIDDDPIYINYIADMLAKNRDDVGLMRVFSL